LISFKHVESTYDLATAAFVVIGDKIEYVFNFVIVIKVNNVDIVAGGWY